MKEVFDHPVKGKEAENKKEPMQLGSARLSPAERQWYLRSRYISSPNAQRCQKKGSSAGRSRTSTSSAGIPVQGMLYWSQQTILVQVLLDSGADFIDSSLVKLNDLAVVSAPKKVLAIDSCKLRGYVVERGPLRSDPVKVKAVEDWPVPSTRKQLQRFLGFANF